MGTVKKSKFRTDNGTDFDTQYFETSADQIKDGVIVDLADLDLVTEPGCLVDAKAVRELYSNMQDGKPVFKDNFEINPTFTTDDLIPGKTYAWILTVYTSLAQTGYNQEINCKQDGANMGVNGDNCHLVSAFSGLCTQGCNITVGSYKTGSTFHVFASRIVFIPLDF